jgi:hypothetical protein
MLYYTFTVRCPYPGCSNYPCTAYVAAESEPPPDAIFTVPAPCHGAPGFRTAFYYLRRIEELPPGAEPIPYPAPSRKPRRWRFGK